MVLVQKWPFVQLFFLNVIFFYCWFGAHCDLQELKEVNLETLDCMYDLNFLFVYLPRQSAAFPKGKKVFNIGQY